MPTKKIEQGEHAARVIDGKGHGPFIRIWNLAENQPLRDLRPNPLVLSPDDELFIPDAEPGTESGETDSTHTFRRLGSTLKLRLLVRNIDGKPVANTDCELTLGGAPIPMQTDGDGRLEHEITADLEDARLVVPELHLDFELKIGHLDPVDELPGVRARLNNLGYFAGYATENEAQLKWALEEFQHENDTSLSGEVDDETKAKLLEVHGV